MSLFKVSRGSEANLPSQKTDGWAYFCTDTGSFWIDHKDANNTLVRSKISANYADKLRYIDGEDTVELDPSEIATHTYVQSAIAGKANTSHTHDDRYYTDTEIDTKLANKQDTITGAATTITGSNLTANRALITNASGKVAVSDVTSVELGHLDGVTSNIQTQLNDKSKVTYKSYSEFDTASTGEDGWYTLFILNDNTIGSVLCLLKGYAHSSVVFTATKGYSANATLNVLDYNSGSNKLYAYIKALRILSDGKVQAQLNTGMVNISIHIVSANGTLTPVNSLVCDTSTDPEVCVSRTLSAGTMMADGFVGDLSGNATSATKAIQDGNGQNIVSTYATKIELSDTESNLQAQLDSKATSSHNHNDIYYTETEVDTKLDNKVDKVSGKGLSTNDLTNALKGNYDTAYNHSQAAHAPVGAQANVIESVKVNGTALTVTNKSVNVTVPTGTLASKSKVSESDLDLSLATKLNSMTDADELEAAISAEAQRVDTALAGKANASHSHNDVYYTETEVDTKLDNKVDKVNGKGLSTNDYTTTEKNKLAGIATGANNYVLPSATDSVVGGMKLYTSTGSNTAGTMTQKAITDALAGKSGTGHNHDSVYSKLGHTHTAADVGATTETYVDNQIAAAKSYTDTKVAGLVDSSPETLNTLNELAAALNNDPNFATTMATELGNKATKTELNTHAGSNIHITSTERTNWNAAKTHADSTHAPSNAERNIIVGIQKNGTDVSVNSSTRTVNITVPTKTSDLTNDSDFATNASVTGVKDELQASIDGKAASSHNHAASNITSGTLSSDRLPTVPVAKGGTGATTAAGALTNLGLTATAAELNVLDGITATTAELNKLDGVTATTAELNYVDGVTSNIQTQLNSKASTTHAHDMKELEGFFIELNNKGTKGTGHGGYLDFHYDGSGADYTSRIIESANGTLSVNGVKCASSGVTCASVNLTNGAQKNKTSGFVKLTNGVILQWGTVANVANGTSTWVNFPLTFPNSVGGTAMLTGNYGNSFGYELHANDISASGFTIVKKGGSSTSGTDTVSWLVVGW